MARVKTIPKRSPAGPAGSRGMKSILKKPVPVPVKKPHRFRPGTAALMEIRREQKSTHYRIPRARVFRGIRKVAQGLKPACRFKLEALDAIHEMLEAKLTELFSDCQRLAIHAKRMTVKETDVEMRRRMILF